MSKQRHKAARKGKLLECHPPPIPKTHVVLSSEGKWKSSVSGETQRNHRAYLSVLPRTLNYSVKPPEFLPNKSLQSATQGCAWSHTDTLPDQTARVGSGVLSCNIENLKLNVFLFWISLLSFSEIFVLGFQTKEGGGSTFSLRGFIRGTDISGRDKLSGCGCAVRLDGTFQHLQVNGSLKRDLSCPKMPTASYTHVL